MKEILLVGLGGGVGSIVRYKLSGLLLHRTLDWRFPAPTFVVNMLGCLAAGVLWALAEKHLIFSLDTRLLLFTGLLGGFTTFSAFGLETAFLLRRQEFAIAALYVGLSVICGIAIIWLTIAALIPSR
ncbi:MAG: fluoride efflux transporter CrcB [Gemmataceae bacterium]